MDTETPTRYTLWVDGESSARAVLERSDRANVKRIAQAIMNIEGRHVGVYVGDALVWRSVEDDESDAYMTEAELLSVSTKETLEELLRDAHDKLQHAIDRVSVLTSAVLAREWNEQRWTRAICPHCERDISLYTMRNGYSAFRKHNSNRNEMCPGSYDLAPGTKIRTLSGDLVDPQPRR